MLPGHCKDVSLREVEHELTVGAIAEGMKGRKAYTRTDYMVLRNGDAHAVIALRKKRGKDLFQAVVGHDVLSLPSDTVFVHDPGLDVINPSSLLRLANRHPGKTVVVEGMFNHLNFVHELQGLPLRVIDDVPPNPSKLSVLAEKALTSGFLDLPIVPEVVDLDIASYIKDVATEAVMFPCRVSGIEADIPVYFLDENPELRHEVTLIGCHLSKRIFESLYRREPAFINVCPQDHVPDDGVPTVIKCCKIKNGFKAEGHLRSVPWGATVPEVAEAIRSFYPSA